MQALKKKQNKANIFALQNTVASQDVSWNMFTDIQLKLVDIFLSLSQKQEIMSLKETFAPTHIWKGIMFRI